MSKILVMTDLHITVPPKTIIDLSPSERAAEALDHAATHHPDADHLVIMGDLIHYGSSKEYAIVQELLRNRPWPISLMLGNHDNRAKFRAAFPDAPVDEAGFIQSCVTLEDIKLICLDTFEPSPEPEHAGRLCPARRDWLIQQLEDAADIGALVFMHHPTLPTHFVGMDEIGLLNAAEINKIFAGSPACRHVFAGHVHRNVTITQNGVTQTIFKSTCHQMPMLLAEGGSTHSVPEPGAYGIILVDGPTTTVHFEDFTLPKMDVRGY